MHLALPLCVPCQFSCGEQPGRGLALAGVWHPAWQWSQLLAQSPQHQEQPECFYLSGAHAREGGRAQVLLNMALPSHQTRRHSAVGMSAAPVSLGEKRELVFTLWDFIVKFSSG